MSLLTARNLSFSYALPEERDLPVFKSADISVREGEILCLLGPSGCGKSTLLKILAGFLSPLEGDIRYKGEPVTSPFMKGQMVFQDPSQLLPWLSVRDNILFPLKRSFFPGKRAGKKESRDELLEQLLEQTGLGEYSHFYPSQLSGGMKQRCALARALYARPDILFMDEPFGSLDAPSRSTLQKLLLKLWREKKTTILFVTHDIAEALILADRLVLIEGLNSPLQIRNNLLSRPRRRQDEAFLHAEAELYSSLESSGMTL